MRKTDIESCRHPAVAQHWLQLLGQRDREQPVQVVRPALSPPTRSGRGRRERKGGVNNGIGIRSKTIWSKSKSERLTLASSD